MGAALSRLQYTRPSLLGDSPALGRQAAIQYVMLGTDVSGSCSQGILDPLALHISVPVFAQEFYRSRVFRSRIVPRSGCSDGLAMELLVDRLVDHIEVVLVQCNI